MGKGGKGGNQDKMMAKGAETSVKGMGAKETKGISVSKLGAIGQSLLVPLRRRPMILRGLLGLLGGGLELSGSLMAINGRSGRRSIMML